MSLNKYLNLKWGKTRLSAKSSGVALFSSLGIGLKSILDMRIEGIFCIRPHTALCYMLKGK